MNPNEDGRIINCIKKKLNVMTRSKYRTTNFSLIEYFADNNFQPLNMDMLIITLVLDYKSNPTKYVLSNEISHFKNEKTFECSIKNAIKKNKSFVKGPGDGQLSLNYQKTLEYLETMYYKYKNNSQDIKTPIKFPRKKEEENKKPKVRKIKHEKNEDDDTEYEIINNKKKINNKNSYLSPEKPFRNKQEKYYGFKSERDSENEIFNLKDFESDPFPNFIKKEFKQENNSLEYIPDIFNKELIKTNLTSSLDKNDIFQSMKYINDYMEHIEEMNSLAPDKEIEEKNKKLEEIKNYLKQLCENKFSCDILCDDVTNLQKEIYHIYKVMKSELDAIKIEINSKTYSYDVYVKLRDIILKYEGKYNNVADILFSKLNELNDKEKNSVDIQISIKRLLTNINTKKKLINSIEKAIKINEEFSFNQFILRDMPNLNRQNNSNTINIEEIMYIFQQERMKIIDVMNDIDNDIGNFSII